MRTMLSYSGFWHRSVVRYGGSPVEGLIRVSSQRTEEPVDGCGELLWDGLVDGVSGAEFNAPGMRAPRRHVRRVLRAEHRAPAAEGRVVIDFGADVLDDECVHDSGEPGREPVDVDAAQGVAEYGRPVNPQMFQHRRGVLDVAGAGENGRPVGEAVSTLVERDDPPGVTQLSGQAREVLPSPLPVQGEQRTTQTAEVEQKHPWIGGDVDDTATGRRGTLHGTVFVIEVVGRDGSSQHHPNRLVGFERDRMDRTWPEFRSPRCLIE